MVPSRSSETWDNKHRWMFRLTGVTACLTFVLLLSGGQVTSYDVGMAVPDWPTTFGQNMFTYPWLNESLGVFVEHRHRLIGATVGLLAIGLALGYWLIDRRGARPWVSSIVLAFIVFQGLLGGNRVMLNSMGIGRELAVCHGIFAQICFVTLIALGCITSKKWMQAQPTSHPQARALRLALGAAWVFLPVTLAFGALQRHLGYGFFTHITLAGIWLLFVLWLNFICYLNDGLKERVGLWPAILAGLTVVQMFLGLGALWATRLALPGTGSTPSTLEALLPTLHLGTGALIYATTTVLCLTVFRQLQPERQYTGEPVGALGGAT